MDIKSIFQIFKRWLWLIILATLVAGGIGYYLDSQETPLYQASTRFVILRAASTGFDYYAFIDHQQLVATYTELLSTEALLDQVSDQLGFAVYSGQANAAQIGDTQFVRLTVTHPDPQKAALIANELVEILIEQNEDLQSVRFTTTEQNLQERADHALTQIDVLQQEIDTITTTQVTEQLTQVETQINQLQSQVTSLEFAITQINQFLPEDEQTRQRLALEAELNQIRPILSLYQQLNTELTVMGEPIQRGDTTTRKVAQIQRTLDIYQQIYLTSISSLEALNLARVQSIPKVVQVEPARVPKNPISPKPMQTGLLFAAVGALSAGGIAFLVEYFDDTLKTPDEVKEQLELPVIGFISDIKSKSAQKNNGHSPVYVINQPRSPVSEAFRSLRTSLEFFSVDRPLKTILVTSSGPQEGKTTIATNLAVVLAQSNNRVLLLDADLRRPNIHNQLMIANRIGLSDLMRLPIELSSAIQVSEKVPDLSVITSGSLPPNPAELLASDRMTRILSELESSFDFIIIDTPPTIVTDAQILSTKIDGLVYIIRPGKTRAVAVKTPLEELRRIHANVIGVVMNRIPQNRGFYYGGYDYYSPKKYGNSYYLDDQHVDLE